MDRPKEAIERMRLSMGADTPDCECTVLEYLDWLEGKHVVEWPVELTRERLEDLSSLDNIRDSAKALYALASIAPQREKRVVNLWEGRAGSTCWADPKQDGELLRYGWRKVAGPIEIED